MKPNGARHFPWGAWLGPALVVMVIWSLPAVGADRRVLCEEFTSVT